MNKKINIISDNLDLIMYAIGFYIITLGLTYITTNNANYIISLYPCIIVFLSYFTRKFSKKYYQFLILHILMFLPILLVKANIVLVLVMIAIYLVLFKLSSFYYAKKNTNIYIYLSPAST